MIYIVVKIDWKTPIAAFYDEEEAKTFCELAGGAYDIEPVQIYGLYKK